MDNKSLDQLRDDFHYLCGYLDAARATESEGVNAALTRMRATITALADTTPVTAEVVDTIPSVDGLTLQLQVGDERCWLEVGSEDIDLVVDRRSRVAEAAVAEA
jgi:hypothetical protein